MNQVFTNNAASFLVESVNPADTTLTIDSAASFPTLEVDEFFLLTLAGSTNGVEDLWEIVKVMYQNRWTHGIYRHTGRGN